MTSLDFRLKTIDETINYHSHQIKHNDLMSKKYITVCRNFKLLQNILFLILMSVVVFKFLHLRHK